MSYLKPKISVVMPIYNVEKYLNECLSSIVEQTFPDIEIICINDGSTDGSPEILEKWSNQDSRIIVYHRNNSGISCSRNFGASKAKGEYIFFIDSDDYLVKNAFDLLYSEALSHNLDVLYFDAELFCDETDLYENFKQRCNYYIRNSEYNGVTSGSFLFSEMINNNDYKVVVFLQFIKLSYYKRKNLFFYEGIIHEDILFSFLCIIQADRVKYIKKILYKKRFRKLSIMTTPRGGKNVIGLFTGMVNIIKFSIIHNPDTNVLPETKKYILRLYENSKNIYMNLPSEEKKSITFPEGSLEDLFFDLLYKTQCSLIFEIKFLLQRFIQKIQKKILKW